ncbi:hypothetical protein KEM54_004129 [Ascosphaera aggregata]|nr:hypothetical protein KEM54_004129 [Ascosphaera aggregata]
MSAQALASQFFSHHDIDEIRRRANKYSCSSNSLVKYSWHQSNPQAKSEQGVAPSCLFQVNLLRILDLGYVPNGLAPNGQSPADRYHQLKALLARTASKVNDARISLISHSSDDKASSEGSSTSHQAKKRKLSVKSAGGRRWSWSIYERRTSLKQKQKQRPAAVSQGMGKQDEKPNNKHQESFVVLSASSGPDRQPDHSVAMAHNKCNNLSPLVQHPPLSKDIDVAALRAIRDTRLRQSSGAPPPCPLPPNPPGIRARERTRERTGGLRQRLRSRSRSKARLRPSLSYHANLNQAEILAYQSWLVSEEANYAPTENASLLITFIAG